MGGVVKAVTKPLTKPFQTGASSAKREAEKQSKLYNEQLKQEQEMRERQENVAKAEASLAEDAMFEGAEEGLGIEGIDTADIGGKRKRRRVQETGSGLGI